MKPVSIEDLWVGVNGHVIVDRFSMHAYEGEVVVLAGPIGSGKSTILKVIAGIIPAVCPGYTVRGRVKVYGMDPREAVERGLVAYVPQDPHMFFIGASVKEEIGYLIHDCVSEWIRELCGETRIDRLSSGQLYRLLLGSAVCSGARILLFDEPTSYLDDHELSLFMERLRRLVDKEDLVAVVVDHRINALEGVADRVIYVRKYPVERVLSATVNAERGVCGRAVLELRGLSIGYDKPIIRDANLVVRSGEIVLVYGRNGSGKTALAKTVAGLLKPLDGRVVVHGRVFYVPQNPIYWFAHDTVYEELQYHSRIHGFKGLDRLIKVLELENMLDRHPYTLSIGEARLLSLALALTANPDLIIVDEPLVGLDTGWIIRIVDLLSRVHAAGVLLLSHSLVLKGIADRCYIIEGGRLIRYE